MTLEEIAAEKAGMHQARIAILARQDEAASRLLRRVVEAARSSPAREPSSVWSPPGRRRGAAAELTGARRDLRGRLPALVRQPPGPQRRRGPGRGRGLLRRGRALLDLDNVRTGFGAVTSPGRLELVRTSPAVVLDAAHNPDGAQRSRPRSRKPSRRRPSSRWSGSSRTRTRRGSSRPWPARPSSSSSTRRTSPRAMDVDSLAQLAAGILGQDRVFQVDDLGGALDWALARMSSTPAAAGSATGSVVTVAEARRLLRRPRRGRLTGGRGTMRMFCASVLFFEAIVVGLAIPVALSLTDADPALVRLGLRRPRHRLPGLRRDAGAGHGAYRWGGGRGGACSSPGSWSQPCSSSVSSSARSGWLRSATAARSTRSRRRGPPVPWDNPFLGVGGHHYGRNP